MSENLTVKPHVLVAFGRNLALVCAAVYAFMRASYYLFTIDPDNMTVEQSLLTGNGALLGAWAGAWIIAGLLCFWDMVKGHTRYGISLVVGIAGSWGLAYGLMWAASGFTGDQWANALSWLAPVGIVAGLLIKVAALHTLLRKAAALRPPVPLGGVREP